MTIWVHSWQLSIYTPAACVQYRQEQKEPQDCHASSVADFVKHLFVGRFRLRCNNETAIMAVAENVKAKMPDRVVVESTPRYSSACNGLAEREIQTIGEQLRTLQYDTQNLYMTRIKRESTVWPWLVRHAGICVTRYARGAGGITPFRAAYDRDYTQEIVPFAKTALFKIKAPEHLGLSSGRRLHKEDTAWEKGTSLGQKNGERFKEGADKTLGNFIVARDTRIWYQTHPVVGDARDIRHMHHSYHQSTETRRTTNQAVQASAHLRHHQRKLRAQFRDT